jgi:hypothetical protein
VLEEIIQLLNELKHERAIRDYAIGEGFAALFYR